MDSLMNSVYDLYKTINELIDLIEAEEKPWWYEDEKRNLIGSAKFEAKYILEELDKIG